MAKNLELSLLYDIYGEMLTEKQRDRFEMYYNNDLSLSEIAENEGEGSRQGVRDCIKRTESLLLNMEERLGFLRRFQEMREGLESICVAARDISTCNDRFGYSREIDERATRIIQITEKLTV